MDHRRQLLLVVILGASLAACQHVNGGSALAGSPTKMSPNQGSPAQTNMIAYDFTSFPYSSFAVDGGDSCIYPKPENILELELSQNCSPRIRTYRAFNGGTFTASIQPPAGQVPGAVTAFYLSSGEGSANHSEVDFEFLGNHLSSVQLNLFVNGVSQGGVWKDLGFNVGDAPHDYTIQWDNTGVTWLVDGKQIYSVPTGGTQPLPNKPMMIYASFWNAGDMLPQWAGTMNWAEAPFWYGLGNVRVQNAN